MTHSDHVLAAIDGAIDDWEVSADAMRWTPDPPTPLPTGGRVASPPVVVLMEISPGRWAYTLQGRWEVSPDVAALLPPSAGGRLLRLPGQTLLDLFLIERADTP